VTEESGRVDSAGVPIAWEAIGPSDGRPVLVVHGFGSNRKANWLDAGWAQPLADAGYRGILVDLRGHGESGRPVGAAHYPPQAFLDDLVAVLDALGLERVGYLGYSFGARLGWELGLTHPERVSALVLGGFGVRDPMTGFDVAAARRFLADGTEIADPLTAQLVKMSSLVPGNDPARIVDVAEGIRSGGFPPVDAASRPSAPVLFAAGERDEVAAGIEDFAAAAGAEFVGLGPRSHSSSITARGFKDAATRFLGHDGSDVRGDPGE